MNLVDALEMLKPVNPIELAISSRTDAGVHALNSTVHIDLESKTGKPMHPNKITRTVNNALNAWNIQIRILKTTPVSNTFHAGFDACSRTYLYRLAVAKQKRNKDIPVKMATNQLFVPIEEYHRCHFILNEDFDIERVKEATKLMEGVHDFRSFMKVSREQKTIRNMMGALICVGRGRTSLRDIYEMLTIPSKCSWNGEMTAAPSCGLYLVNVEYPEHVFENCGYEDVKEEKEDELGLVARENE